VIVGAIDVEGDAFVLDDGETQSGIVCSVTMGGETIVATETGRYRTRRLYGERIGVSAEAIAYESDIVFIERIRQAVKVARLDPREVRHQNDGRLRATRGDPTERSIDDRGQWFVAAIAQDLRASGVSKIGDVIAIGGHENARKGACVRHIEDVLEESPSEARALIVREYGSQARLTPHQRFCRDNDPHRSHRDASTANASTSRARRARSSRERMIVDVPKTGTPITVASSPRSMTIARKSPR
jgi:hypothetical protein